MRDPIHNKTKLNPFVHSLKKTKMAELTIERAIYAAALKNSSHFAINSYAPAVDLDGVDIVLRVEQNGIIIYAAVAVISGALVVLSNGKMNSIAAVARRHANARAPYFLLIKNQNDDRFARYDSAEILSSNLRSLRPKKDAFVSAEEAVNTMISSILSETYA